MESHHHSQIHSHCNMTKDLQLKCAHSLIHLTQHIYDLTSLQRHQMPSMIRRIPDPELPSALDNLATEYVDQSCQEATMYQQHDVSLVVYSHLDLLGYHTNVSAAPEECLQN
jgi:hypothetical protein